MSRSEGWVRKFFVERSDLFLKLMNSKWRLAPEEARLISRLLEIHGVGRGARLLEVGCGSGRIAINLARLGYSVVGIDVSPTYISEAVRRSREEGVQVEFLVGDARRVDEVVGARRFDAVLFYWTSVLGYYDEVTDFEILARCRKVVEDGGKLLILQHANRDHLILAFSVRRVLESRHDLGDYVVVEESRLDLLSSRYVSTWSFYRKEGNALVLIDTLETSQRVYSIHELVSIARRAGWDLEKAYASIATLEEFTKPAYHPALNLVFKTS